MEEVIFSAHANRAMVERGISSGEVIHVLEHGKIIQEYPDDTPYPSRLMLGRISGAPLHVVAAGMEKVIVVITAYWPDPGQWSNDFETRL